jgi:hypothetical protein
VGPALEEGKRYTLVVDRKWLDAQGEPLVESHRKSFRVVAPDDEPPDASSWKLQPPAAGSTAPLVVTFPEPLDHAMLQRVLWITNPEGERIAGQIEVDPGETRWRFTPAEAWVAGNHHLVAEATLEDRAGNSLGRPFEVDVFEKVEQRVQSPTVEVPFEVR